MLGFAVHFLIWEMTIYVVYRVVGYYFTRDVQVAGFFDVAHLLSGDDPVAASVSWSSCRTSCALHRGVNGYGTGGTCPPQYLWRGASMVMSPNILEVMSFRLSLFSPVTETTVVCCILIQILCVVSQKSFSFWGTPYRGSAHGPRWGTSVPQVPSILWCPPNNHVRSTPLALQHFILCSTTIKYHRIGFKIL